MERQRGRGGRAHEQRKNTEKRLIRHDNENIEKEGMIEEKEER